jgi:hypothetical protein
MPMIVVGMTRGRWASVILLSYVNLIAATAAWLTWRAIRDRRDLGTFTSPFFRGLALAMVVFAVVILALSTTTGSVARSVLLTGFSMVGIVTSTNMLTLAGSRNAARRWWLAQYLNGVTLNFAATHASFFGFGLARVLPELSGPWMRTVSQLSILGLALMLRLWIGRRYLRSQPIEAVNLSTEPASLPSIEKVA